MSPKIGTVQGAAIRVIWWEIQLKIETNPCSPRIGTVRETASNFEGVFRHFVMNLSDCFWLQATVYVHGRDNQSFPPSLVHKEWLNLALTFSAAALRGSPHSSHHQKQIQISLMVRRAGLSSCPYYIQLIQKPVNYYFRLSDWLLMDTQLKTMIWTSLLKSSFTSLFVD